MYSIKKSMKENSSTPKRRRLGMSKILRSPEFCKNHDVSSVCSPINNNVRLLKQQVERCESPPLPCNQIEYLCDSGNNSSSCSEIPCSPVVLNSSVVRDIENWESLSVTKEKGVSLTQNLAELEDISDDMFYSRLEQSCNDDILTSRCEQHFRENIEESFAAINSSIYQKAGFEVKQTKDSLFETKDSFLLDIKESCITNEDGKSKKHMSDNVENFYGLPVKTKSFFKTYRNIEKFYDWQEECLNLDAIRNRENLIYALPTSGGKTLVAEVLMLREVLNNRKNVLFILPFVAIVQEKIWALSPFAVNLDFLVEEYAAGKGHIPPKKRRSKHSIYIATIEKGLALVRSLLELGRLNEIGLMVVDELHLIGEAGRGATLETLLSTVLFANQGIQIVGMSATIGNLPEVARFLRAHVFQRHFRPVALDEYVKRGQMLYRVTGGELEPERELNFDYTSAATALDPDCVGGLVAEVVPGSSCLVFCPTKRNAENVASLLCKVQRKEMTLHRTKEREALEAALKSEGAAPALAKSVRYGVAYHHSGLASDERSLLEQAFRSGVISVLCCTSTLAAGVNLPARRVIIRAPRVGRAFLSLGAYRQMCGRAGRAGHTDSGESIIICSDADWPELQAVLRNGLPPVVSSLPGACTSLVLSGVALKLADTRSQLRNLLSGTFMATSSEVDIKQICDDSIRLLIQTGALDVGAHKCSDESHAAAGQRVVYSDSRLTVSRLGRAAIKGCMELSVAKQMLQDLESASRGLVLMGSLHLLYLVTPHDAAGVRPDYRHYYSLVYNVIASETKQMLQDLELVSCGLVLMGSLHLPYLVTPHDAAGVRPDCRHYYSLYCNLDEAAVQTAKILGITEMNAIRMMTGKPITNVSEKVLCRFYVALMLYDLWKQMPFHVVADKYSVSRGAVQGVLTSAAAAASSATRFCDELEHLWTFRALFSELAPRLAHCAAPELSQLMELPAVKKARALQLARAGYKRVEDLAKASVDDLTASVAHLSRSAATHLVSAARVRVLQARALQLARAGYKRVEDLAKASVDDLTASVAHLSRSAATHLVSAARVRVLQARALQLARAGYKRVEDLAKASVDDLTASVAHLSRSAATHLVSAARVRVLQARALQLARAGYKRVEDLAKASVDDLTASVAHLSRSAATHLVSAARVRVLQARALQLARAGYKRVEDLAKASVDDLTASVAHLSRSAATHLVSAARVRVLQARALQLARAGYKRVEDLAKASVDDLTASVAHLSRSAATHLVSAARVRVLQARALQLARAGYKRVEDLAKASVDDLTASVAHLSRSAATHLVSAARVRVLQARALQLARAGYKRVEDLAKASVDDLTASVAHLSRSAATHLVSAARVRVLQARALQLARAGYKRVEDLAKASVDDLTASVAHLSRSAATHLVSAARVRVLQARALQLARAGYKRVEDLAKASVDDLTASVAHLSRSAATHLVSAARVRVLQARALQLARAGYKRVEDLAKASVDDLTASVAHLSRSAATHLVSAARVRVLQARALQLARAGYKRVEDLAKASVDDLTASVAHLSRSAATHLVSAARMMLIEKVENLRAEAEDVMEDLQMK